MTMVQFYEYSVVYRNM